MTFACDACGAKFIAKGKENKDTHTKKESVKEIIPTRECKENGTSGKPCKSDLSKGDEFINVRCSICGKEYFNIKKDLYSGSEMRCDSCPGKGILEPVPISTEIDKKQENSGYSLINTKHVMALIVALFCVYIVYDIIKQKITFVKGYETKIVFLYDNDAFRDTHLNEVKDINEYTQNGWEIKSSRRATGLYNSAGTEYTLQKPIYGP